MMSAQPNFYRVAFRSLMICILFVGSSVPSWPNTAKDSVACSITATKRDGLYVMRGFVRSSASLSGTYRLLISKTNSGGTSQSIQQGAFEWREGQSGPVATTAFEAAAEGHVIASMTLETGRGTIRCEFPD
jgi:hypothetical protein